MTESHTIEFNSKARASLSEACALIRGSKERSFFKSNSKRFRLKSLRLKSLRLKSLRLKSLKQQTQLITNSFN